ncbi:hypothetical protein JCM19000A_32260 [Silvimonas sp. JCM 19000]
MVPLAAVLPVPRLTVLLGVLAAGVAVLLSDVVPDALLLALVALLAAVLLAPSDEAICDNEEMLDIELSPTCKTGAKSGPG